MEIGIPSLSFNLIFDHAQLAAIMVMDKEGIILDTNLGFKNSFGYNKEDLHGKHFSLLFIEDDKGKNQPEIELTAAMQKGTITDINYVVHKDGSYIWSHGETVLTKGPDGKIYFVKIIFDIQQQKLLEKFLIKSNRDLSSKNEILNRVNKDLDTFVYTASHDLKAPINNIEALLTSLEDEIKTDQNQNLKEIVSMLHTSVEKFQTTLKHLTEVGRLEATFRTETMSWIDFEEMMNNLKADLKESMEESSAILKYDFSRAPSIRFSWKNLQSIMYNLISNAIKYRSPDRRPEIAVMTERKDDHILLKVSDNGLGIKEKDKAKVFEMYQRLHDHVEGTGVGLNIVKRIVDNSGGYIKIDSEVGKGTTFNVYFKI